MTAAFEFGEKSTGDIKDAFVLSSTDYFWDKRHLLEAGFYTHELQKAVRIFIKAEHFFIHSFQLEKLKAKMDEFIAFNTQLGKTLELFIRWLDRGADYVSGSGKVNAYSAWRSAIQTCWFSRPGYEVQMPNRTAFEQFRARYKQQVYDPDIAMEAAIPILDKSWDCFLDDNQMKNNFAIKSEWDRKIYQHAVIEYELEATMTFRAMGHDNRFKDFIDWYDETFSPKEKEAFYNEAADALRRYKIYNADWLTMPLEALRDPTP